MAWLESLQVIKNRIQSISSTRQITQSMRLVSTAKVQKVRARMVENRPFLEQTGALISAVAADPGLSRHPYLTQRGRAGGKCAVVLISGDRGLCGGYNVNVCRKASGLIRTLDTPRIVTVGGKARDYCRRRYKGLESHSFTGISETPFFDDAKEIAGLLFAWYNKEEIDKVYVVYTQFENMMSQQPVTEVLLPLPVTLNKDNGPLDCEPGEEALLAQLAPYYAASFLYGAILESSVCEQSARVTSMDTAVKSADDMMDSLTLQYNRARQWAITQEIVEVVGGANAQM